MERKSTTAAPLRKEHFERLRWVRRAVWGIEWRAADVMRVCATSRCVRCGSRGRRMSNVEEGRMVHSWRERRVIGNAAGSKSGVERTLVNASRKLAEEQAQRSKAFKRGRSQSKVFRTSELRSLSICS